MKLYNVIILFYVLVFALFGGVILGFAFHLVDFNDLVFQLAGLYNSMNARLALGAGGLLFILFALVVAQIIASRREKEKNIAFTNPLGSVTVTLSAVEDLIRCIARRLPQIKELKPDVVAKRKRGIQVNIKLVLKSEVNVPDFTSQLQEIIKQKIQDVFGIDEMITVRIYISKMVLEEEKVKLKENVFIKENDKVNIPYPRI